MSFPFPRPFPGPSMVSFSVLSLFSSGEQGAWYDPSDFTTMFQDAAGTTPVTAVEQPVGLLLDKSKGLAIGAEMFSTFTTVNSPWTANGGGSWSINGSQGANTDLTNSTLFTVGNCYVTTFTLSGVSGGTVSVFAGEGSGVNIGNGTYTYRRFATQAYLIFRAGPGVSATVSSVSVKALPGNHASQSTAASRPVLSARVNLLTYSEQFDNAAWVNSQTSDAGNTTTAPDGTTTADTLTATAGTNSRFIYQIAPAVVSGAGYTVSFSAKAGTHGAVQFCSSDGFGVAGYVNFNLSTGAIGTSSTYTGSISSQGNGWYRCTVTLTATSAAAPNLIIGMVADASATRAASWTAAGTETIFLWGADLRVTNVGVNLPSYQRVGAATDYDTSGFPLYLKFDGVDDSIATGTIDFSATDKMSVFAGVRKLSDAAGGEIVSLGNITSVNGSFELRGPRAAAPNYMFGSRGTSFADANIASGYSAPITNVVTGIADISVDLCALRINGTVVASPTTDQGTGNYSSGVVFVGRLGGTALSFNGNLYSIIVRGALSTDAQIASTETYVNNLTKAY